MTVDKLKIKKIMYYSVGGEWRVRRKLGALNGIMRPKTLYSVGLGNCYWFVMNWAANSWSLVTHQSMCLGNARKSFKPLTTNFGLSKLPLVLSGVHYCSSENWCLVLACNGPLLKCKRNKLVGPIAPTSIFLSWGSQLHMTYSKTVLIFQQTTP